MNQIEAIYINNQTLFEIQPPTIQNAYREYNEAILSSLKEQQNQIAVLTTKNAKLPCWIKERQIIAQIYIRAEYCSSSILTLVDYQALSEPDKIINSVSQACINNNSQNIPKLTEFSANIIWSEIIDSTVRLKQTTIPLLVWDLDLTSKTLTITVTSSEAIEQCDFCN